MANNAIGSASVVLSANADQLSAGLAKAEQAVNKFAGKAAATAAKAGGPAAGGSAGGGLISKLLLGGGIGAGIELAKKIWTQVQEPLERLSVGGGSRFKLGGLAPTDRDVGRLSAAKLSVDRLLDTVAAAAVKIGSGLGPGIESFADAISAGLVAAAPLIDRVARGLGAVLFVVGEVASAFVEYAGRIIDQIGEWITAQTGIGVNAKSVEQIVLETARAIGVGFAYVWDGMKVGVRVVSVAAGLIVESLGKILGALADVAKGAADIAKGPLDSFGNRFNSGANRVLGWVSDKTTEVGQGLGERFDSGADRIKGWSDSIKGLGQTMRAQGMDALRDFGSSVNDVNRFFDKADAKIQAKRVGNPIVPKLAGALEKGSKEAYSAIVKNQYGGFKGNDPIELQKKQLRAEEEANASLRLIRAALESSVTTLRII